MELVYRRLRMGLMYRAREFFAGVSSSSTCRIGICFSRAGGVPCMIYFLIFIVDQ